MIVYIFNDLFFKKMILPTTISGMYPIYINNKFFANITDVNNEWTISVSENISLSSNVGNVLKSFEIYKLIETQSNNEYFLISTPKYDDRTTSLIPTKDTILIGSSENCDIRLNLNVVGNDTITLSFKDDLWKMVSTSSNVFVDDKRSNYERIYNGEVIFFYGLKIIIINKMFILNDPNGHMSINSSSFTQYLEQPTTEEAIINEYDEAMPLFKEEDYFYKSPRLGYVTDYEEVNIDEPPAPYVEDETPVILTIGPQLTMATTSLLSLVTTISYFLSGSTSTFRFVISLLTTGVMLAGSLLWPSITRAYNKRRMRKKEEKRQVKYIQYLEKKKKEIEKIKFNQKESLLNDLPHMDKCKRLTEPGALKTSLWYRTIEHEDFLSVRLGIGKVNTKIRINEPQTKFSIDDEDKLFTKLQEVVESSKTIDDAPISVSLTENFITAVIGKDEQTKELLDSVFLQSMTLHSYTELKIIVYTSNPKKWDYLKILPHCWDNQKTIRYFATNLEEFGVITSELEKLFDARVAKDETVKQEDDGEKREEADFRDYRPYYLIFIDDIVSLRNVSLIKKILHYKKNIGFSLLMQTDKMSVLPSETKTFIHVDEPLSALMTTEIGKGKQKQFAPELNKTIDVYECASALSNIPIRVEKAKYELPSSLSFLEMYGVGKVEQLNSIERWKSNNPVLNLSVPIGIDQNGELFKMDIHEKAYGPHGLVAGTTGSGKSEWIITYILSLAVNFSPDEVQFVLIDYKGGGLAMSFENSELGVKLPHLAGTITNLDKSEINRSIAALESELKRRQSIFNDAREKLKEGSMNIYKYQQFYRKGLVDEPLSHLLIICDEFAELKSQQSEFMDQLISTSRIGRSLGVHLILATQKPSGVVNDQIWSNSKFKVCLKVQDRADSNEVLKKPDAAYLKQTGAFYLQVGNDDYYNLGQSAWAGAKYYPSNVMKKKTDQSAQYIDNVGRIVGTYALEQEQETKKENKGEELLNIVSYIDNISKNITIKSAPLWLENIADVSYLKDDIALYNHKPAPYNYNIAIGKYDEPRRQEQGLLTIDLSHGNIGVVENSGNGREKFLSTLLWSSMIEHTPYELAHYIIDFGAETLKKFAKFPHVGEVVFQDEIDKVVGIVDLILEELEKRKDLLSDYNGSFEYYNRVSKQKLPLIVLTINGYDVFLENLPKAENVLNTLFRDAPKYGIVFVLTTSTSSSIRSRQQQYFNHMIYMNLSDDANYRTYSNCRKGLIPKKVTGRGICKLDETDVDSYVEFQTASIAPEEVELEYIRQTADVFVKHYNYKVKELAKIPDNVTSEDLAKYCTDLAEVPIGFNFYEKDIAKYNFASEKLHLCTSKNLNGNINFLYGLVGVLVKIPNVKVRVVDLLDIFKKPILDIQYFNSDMDTVIAALEKDILTRTDSQDYGINLIIGAGSYKSKLSRGGIEIFQNVFDKITGSKKNIIVLIDEYDKLRTLKLETWYNKINTSKGLWLGPEFGNQSMFNTNELTAEDKKYNYEGLAFNIDNGKYTVIKTVMDGDD